MMQVELKAGSPKHKRILDMVLARRRMSRNKMKEYYPKWDEADESFRAYQPKKEADQQRDRNRKAGNPEFTTLVVPYSFAIVMTAHTYWSSVFLSRNPVYQLQGRHGEAQNSVLAFESILEYQKTVGHHLVPLFNWIFDMSKYGLGIVGSYWDKQVSHISRVKEVPVTLGGVRIGDKTKKVMQTVQVTKYEGNRIFNTRPYDWFPDPRVSISSFQEGEFCGRDTQVGWHEILQGKEQGRYFNVDELAQRIRSGAYDRQEGSSQVILPDAAGEVEGGGAPGPGFVHLHEMTVLLVPKLWGLSNVQQVQKWFFTIANGDVVIGAQPQGLYHDAFPFDVMEFGQGAHEFIKQNLPEVMQPLINTLSWLFNSHFYNVRKSLNDVRVVDPSRVVMKDLVSPIERGIVRLKPEAYGTDARTAVHQLDVRDVTMTHLRDASIVEMMIQRITGVVDELMGMSQGPSRESATGVRTRTGFAANRLKTIAEYNSALGFQPLIEKLTSNTQQLMQDEIKVRIAGEHSANHPQGFLQVSPDMIAGQYDYSPVDGTLPIDRMAQANFWKELTIQVANSPQVAAEWRVSEMMAHIMRLLGEKNIERFKIDLRDPQEIQEQLTKGQLVAAEGASNGTGAPTSGGRLQSAGSSGASI